jgi:hypothetical protein
MHTTGNEKEIPHVIICKRRKDGSQKLRNHSKYSSAPKQGYEEFRFGGDGTGIKHGDLESHSSFT